MKIEFIREFLHLTETLNFSLSASQLFISQPTLSRHIQILEKEIGHSLVYTSSHGVFLTKYGELAIPHFHRILSEYAQYLTQCENLSKQVSGTLRIGILYYSMDDYFSSFLEHLNEKFPSIEFSVSNYQPQPLYEDLLHGKVDVASLTFFDMKRHTDLKLQKIGTQGTIIMMHKDHSLAEAEKVTLDDLTGSALISLKNDLHSNEVVSELLDIKGIHFPHTLYTDNIETVPIMIRKNGGVHLTGESCRKQNASGICYKDLYGSDTRSDFCLASLPGNNNPLIDLLYSEAREFFA